MYFRHVSNLSDHELVKNNHPVHKTYIQYISNSEKQVCDNFKNVLSFNCEQHYTLTIEGK